MRLAPTVYKKFRAKIDRQFIANSSPCASLGPNTKYQVETGKGEFDRVVNCKPKRLSSYAQPNTVAHKTARQSLCRDTPQKQEGIIVPEEHSNKPTEDLQIEEVKDTPVPSTSRQRGSKGVRKRRHASCERQVDPNRNDRSGDKRIRGSYESGGLGE
jgi:hypothetical protein